MKSIEQKRREALARRQKELSTWENMKYQGDKATKFEEQRALSIKRAKTDIENLNAKLSN